MEIEMSRPKGPISPGQLYVVMPVWRMRVSRALVYALALFLSEQQMERFIDDLISWTASGVKVRVAQ